MPVEQAKFHVESVIETSRSLCVDTRGIRGRSREIRHRSRLLRLHSVERPGNVPGTGRPPGVARSGSIAVSYVREASGIVARVAGEVDMASTPALAAALQPHLDAITAGADVVVDLSGVTFIDLSGVTLLIAATETARSNGGTVRVVGCPPRVSRLLLLSGTRAALNLG